MSPKVRIALIALALASLAPGAAAVDPFAGSDDLAKIEAEERRLWDQAEEFDDIMRRSGQLYEDQAFVDYLQGIADRLYPELKGHVRIKMLKSPILNAFALPNGSVYVNQGLVSRFQNEAQLATVIGHEIAHFELRHGYRQRSLLKNTLLLRAVVQMLGVPSQVDIVFSSSMFGYSRELESEADELGYQHVAAAGYDVKETPKVFEHLIRETKTSEVRERIYLFSSHPKLQDRVDNYARLSRNAPDDGIRNTEEYLQRIGVIRLTNIQNELTMGRAKNVLLALCSPESLSDYPPEIHYYLGEAYRQRGAMGDDVSSEFAYMDAVRLAPNFAPSYRALGIIYLKDGAYADAEGQFARYLELAPEAPDIAYVLHYLRLAREKQGKS